MALKSDPIDLKMDLITGELVIGNDLEFVSGPDAVAQLLMRRLKTFVGEWFANLNEGVDYYGRILGQKYNEVAVRGAIRPVILGTPGVKELIALTTKFDGATRTVSISWRVSTSFDDKLIDGTLSQTI